MQVNWKYFAFWVMIAARWNLRSTLQETPSLNFVIQSALDNAKLLNWNFRLLESDVLVPAMVPAAASICISLFRGSQPFFFVVVVVAHSIV